MTTLETLQTEAREKFAKKWGWLEDWNSDLDDFAANIYSMALQEALGKVPDAYTTYGYPNSWFPWNKCREKTRQGIESLIPKNEV